MDIDGRSEPVELDPLFERGVLNRCAIENEREEDLYVAYALELDDGEAMSLAVAESRGLPLATDERKARRVVRDNCPQLPLISTAEVIHEWAQSREASEIVAAVRSIHYRARFQPSDPDPLAPWWATLLNS
jgi:predicted nucleic acid-binding protein